MAGNSNLASAMEAKQDEFYTQLRTIEDELRHYRKHFKGKTVLCNCDDPFESNFFKYFALNFNKLGLKKLIATCYSGSSITGTQLSLFGDDTDEERRTPYKAVVTTVHDATGNGGVDMLDVAELFRNGENKLERLDGDGDFRSPECLELLDEADIVVTNPPFSLFREYIATLVAHNKKFVVIGNQNAITYKEIFPLIKNNELWLGYHSGHTLFEVPDTYGIPDFYDKSDRQKLRSNGYVIDENGKLWRNLGNICWFTNLDIRKRHDQMILIRKYGPEEYPRYDNYDAIEVSMAANIPMDYAGVMGVPITFLDKFNPDQFEIIDVTQSWGTSSTKRYPRQTQVSKNGKRSQVTKLNDGAAIRVSEPPQGKTYYMVDGENYIKVYARVLIRNKNPEVAEK